jgi:predicted AAA+ superfamily ATPase
MIVREDYLRKLRLLKDQNLIKVITGIRRSGKSSLLQAFSLELKNNGTPGSNILFFNFEERENIQLNNWSNLYDEIIQKTSETEKYYIFLDEVQLIIDFEKLVNALFTKKNIDLYVTGSNAYLLSSELATLLSGRYIAINIHPFSFKEYTQAFAEDGNTDRLFRKYMNASSFPEAVSLSKIDENLVNDYLQTIYNTVVIKDIATRYKLRNLYNLKRLIDFVFEHVGSYLSPGNIAKELSTANKSISHNTITKYLDFLVKSYILYPAARFDIKGKELLQSNEKYYLIDLGLNNITTTNKFELLRRGGKVYVGKNNEKEIDFIVQKANNEYEYYQVAYTVSDEKTLARELAAFQNIRDGYPKYLLTMDFDTTNINGIQKINVIDWLLR